MKSIFGINLDAIASKPRELERVIERFADHPVVQEILAEDENQRIAARRAIGEQMQQHLAETEVKREEIEREFLDAHRELQKLESSYEKAAARYRKARDTRHLFEHQAKTDLERQTAALERIPSPQIDETISALTRLHDAVHQVPTERVKEVTNGIGRRKTVIETNRNSIINRAKAIRDALTTCYRMKAEADHSDLPRRLKALIDDLPPAEMIEKIEIQH